MSNEITPVDKVKQDLAEAGFDFETELSRVRTETAFDIPRVRIEHKENGKHRLYFDFGESYFQSDQEKTIKNNTLVAVVFAQEQIRAFWLEGETFPTCSSINGEPQVNTPVHSDCKNCPEAAIGANCKPKQRLWLLIEQDEKVLPVVMALSPTSIKHWHRHVKMLAHDKLPPVVVQTELTLADVKKNGYRWAEVHFGIKGVVSKEILVLARRARDELQRLREDISYNDYSDPGDKLPF